MERRLWPASHRERLWFSAAVAVALVAGHGAVLSYAYSHVALSAGLIAGAGLLVVVKHLGLLGPVFALFRRHGRKG